MSAPGARGFTLIEVLAALIIVSLGFLAVIQAVSQTVNNANYLREKTIAHWVAMNKLTELRLAATPPPSGDSNGDVEMAGSRWHWRMTVKPTAAATMLRIDINVAPHEAGDKASIANISGFYGRAIAHGRIEWGVNPVPLSPGPGLGSTAASAAP